MNRIAGGLMLVAGAYVAYYGWYEIRVLNGATGDPIVDAAVELQTWLESHRPRRPHCVRHRRRGHPCRRGARSDRAAPETDPSKRPRPGGGDRTR
ncbi:MAG: hypothetical protein WKF45_06720 [Ilumatobacteraceae bacterium]